VTTYHGKPTPAACEVFRCEWCRRSFKGKRPYLAFDDGDGAKVWRQFCSENHADFYFRKKYNLKFDF